MELGPGTLKFGPEGTEIDASCLINNARVEIDKEQDDARYKLCGTATPGKITYTTSHGESAHGCRNVTDCSCSAG